MSGELALPPEIIANILSFVTDSGLGKPYLLRPNDEDQRVKNLSTCCLINRDWYIESTSMLYSRFRHTARSDSFAKIWHFLRTIVEKPDLGALVKHLDFRDHTSYSYPKTIWEDAVSQGEQRSRRREIRAVLGIAAQLEITRLAEALHLQKRLPFMIILMKCVPNVSKLHLSKDFRNPFIDNRFSTKTVFQILKDRKALPRLREVTLFDLNAVGQVPLGYWPSLEIDGMDSLFLLPSIGKLDLFDLETFAALDQLPSGTSSVAHLTITCGGDDRRLDPENLGLKACLRMPKALVSLTLYMKSFMSMGGESRLNFMIAHDELWRMLCHYKDSLEYLDLYDDDATRKQHRPEFNRKAPMGKLHEFNRLTTLRVQPEMLLGGVNGILKAHYRLRDALPPSLHSLTFYNFYDEKGLINGQDLQTELLHVVTETALVHNLRFLIVQDTYKNFLRNSPRDEELVNRLNNLHNACCDRNVIFRIMSDTHLPRGGANLLKHPEAHKPEERAHDAWRRGVNGVRGDTPAEEKYEFVLPPGVDLVRLV